MPRKAAAPRRPATIPQAAEHAGVSRPTIRRRIADGTLPAYRFGPRLIRVDLDDVEAMFRPMRPARPTKGAA